MQVLFFSGLSFAAAICTRHFYVSQGVHKAQEMQVLQRMDRDRPAAVAGHPATQELRRQAQEFGLPARIGTRGCLIPGPPPTPYL